MATYAIGDIQGCMGTLQLLLERIGFRAGHDHVIVVGDLVNRGPDSLGCLRWAYGLRDHITMVLGNHDLALLARAAQVRPQRPNDTFEDVLRAPDRAQLLTWLQARPFASMRRGRLVVHAGVLPAWTPEDVLAHGAVAEQALQGNTSSAFLAALETQARAPSVLENAVAQARVLTYLRVLNARGEPHYSHKGPLSELPEGFLPWFAAPSRATANTTILCGHWAALGLHVQHNVRALDTGCVWGGPLTALCLETEDIIQMPYSEKRPPLCTRSD